MRVCIKYLVESLVKTNNKITGSNNITLRKGNIKLYGFDKISIYKELIEALSNKRLIQWKKNYIYNV